MVEFDDLSQNSGVTIKYRELKPYSSPEIKVLLLENIHPAAVRLFENAGFQVSSNFIVLLVNF